MVSQLPTKVFGQDQLHNDHQPYLKFDISGKGHILAASEMHVSTAVKEITPLGEQRAGLQVKQELAASRLGLLVVAFIFRRWHRTHSTCPFHLPTSVSLHVQVPKMGTER